MTFYWISNAIAIVCILCLFGLGWVLSRRCRNFGTLNITLTAVLVALSIVFTNVIGYNLKIFGIQIALGNFVIFLIGMLMGPLVGVVGGLIGDSVGSLINISGTYHVNFLLVKILFGFCGSLVFLGKGNKFLMLKVFGLFIFVCGLQIWILNPIGLYSMNGWKSVWITLIPSAPRKGITWLVQSLVYPTLAINSFKILWQLYKRSSYASSTVWAFKNDNLFDNKKQQVLVKLPLSIEPKQQLSPKNVNDKVEKI
ncbi:ECF transporter S component (folate family) [Entomoplasma freundtii]|uniref:Uncharacterized protein n=1 Tax=Entomoplasma freundtii TaxID=74700 RepID=A0A2K8NS48_9MOLU|nr:folate family ECF transporter S component [Entomoplasma freundtii]ATZ16660.1 hypothetical protein EFREU_v1c06400 [Entomoplasma freundtii]TDY58173.1 ECF transporter S component (folate family) [Entomoplasma freundtii]